MSPLGGILIFAASLARQSLCERPWCIYHLYSSAFNANRLYTWDRVAKPINKRRVRRLTMRRKSIGHLLAIRDDVEATSFCSLTSPCYADCVIVTIFIMA